MKSKYCSAVKKKKKELMRVTTLIDLRNIVLREQSHLRPHIEWFYLYEISRKGKTEET